MSISPGRDLAQYRIVDRIGEGGMGVVWRAHDGTLGRDVAIKVLPEHYATDPERMARFEREARLLAALNHPHIASIYGLHSDGATRFLAMELVEGEDLAQRIARGPLPLAEALPLALQIAQALEHAHERGVIHRDLKPANVKLTADGRAKVLDFGLAKALEGDPSATGSSPSLSNSPTLTHALTGSAVLLGTAAYMAPEQARGQAADRRADIWSFGVVCMEMLTGRRLFEGDTISDTLASVLKVEPDWSALPAATPRRVRALLGRCLTRDPRQRLRDIGEARIELESILAGPLEEPAARAVAAAKPGLTPVLAGAAGVLLGTLVAWGGLQALRPPAAARPLQKFEIVSPLADAPVRLRAISPDGRRLAFAIADTVWVRDLGELHPRNIGDFRSLAFLLWSPDSRHLGIGAGSKLYRVEPASGDRQIICDAGGPFTGGSGASWGENGTVVYSRAEGDGLMQVSTAGGDPKSYLPIDSTESDLHEPWLLPGGRGVLFCPHTKRSGVDNITLFARGKRKVLLRLEGQSLSRPAYSPTGHIVFGRGGTGSGVWAVPFSLARLEVTGDPILLAANAAGPSISAEGTLVYVASASDGMVRYSWFDRAGNNVGMLGAAMAAEGAFRLTPDGRAFVYSLRGDDQSYDLWMHDIARETRSRLTFDEGDEASPSFSADGRHVLYHAALSGSSDLRVLRRSIDGTGTADTLAAGVVGLESPDGRYVTYTSIVDGWDIMLVAMQGDRTPTTLVPGRPRASGGEISPDGRWLAYMSDESGTWQIYLTTMPSGQGRWQVSTTAGQWPRWDRTGRRLFYAQNADIMELSVEGTTSPVLGAPRKLFTRADGTARRWGFVPQFDVTGDGERFLVQVPERPIGEVAAITVVQNWPAEFANRR